MTNTLARQIMMQQLFNEERIRSEGQSGVKQKRSRYTGTKPYHADTFSHTSFLQMHDHANHKHTVGMGEFIGVLNGVEFRTRHNDYGLYRPSTTSRDYHAVEEIELPDVPPEVLAKTTVDDQITEMREWFRAWKEQKHSTRDYRKYFKPILCYLEGAWTIADKDHIDEPFKSDRHFIAAKDWNELHQKIKFMSYTGSKDNSENFAFLPTSIIDIVDGDKPVFAQWNYRIMCHPLRKYVHTNRLRVVDDLAPRVAYGFDLEKHKNSRAARFTLNPINSDVFKDKHATGRQFLDELMEEIPGKDNYYRSLSDNSFGLECNRIDDSERKQNVANYHRSYLVNKKSANGRQQRHRGFSDDSVFMAMNSQDKVAAQTVYDKCYTNKKNVRVCKDNYKQKWSYAVPLEIIYLTPLGQWNPYDIVYNETAKQCKTCRGGRTKDTAYSQASSKFFYRTPAEFFTGKKVAGDASDTSGRSVGMLNRKGEVCVVRASGVYIGLPMIAGLGVLRQRYPIAPVHQEGEAVWKELQALKDLILDQSERFVKLRNDYGLNTVPTNTTGVKDADVLLKMAYAPPNDDYGVTQHSHSFQISPDDVKKLQAGGVVKVRTSTGSGHSHSLEVKYNQKLKNPYYYVTCDGKSACWDKHGKYMSIAE